jgi:hypothetical protein
MPGHERFGCNEQLHDWSPGSPEIDFFDVSERAWSIHIDALGGE